MVCGYSRKDIPCEILGICTLVHANQNFSDELLEMLIILLQNTWILSQLIQYLFRPKTSTFFYTHSHLSELQNCALIFPINFQFNLIFKNTLHNLGIELCSAHKNIKNIFNSYLIKSRAVL